MGRWTPFRRLGAGGTLPVPAVALAIVFVAAMVAFALTLRRAAEVQPGASTPASAPSASTGTQRFVLSEP